jgi:hypothetical protein
MSDRLSVVEAWIIRLGVFLVFLVTFGDYVFHKIWPIIGPICRQMTDRLAASRMTRAHKEENDA